MVEMLSHKMRKIPAPTKKIKGTKLDQFTPLLDHITVRSYVSLRGLLYGVKYSVHYKNFSLQSFLVSKYPFLSMNVLNKLLKCLFIEGVNLKDRSISLLSNTAIVKNFTQFTLYIVVYRIMWTGPTMRTGCC